MSRQKLIAAYRAACPHVHWQRAGFIGYGPQKVPNWRCARCGRRTMIPPAVAVGGTESSDGRKAG